DQASAMASHVTTAGGFAIVTHAYPLSSAGQAAPGTVASKLPWPMQTFLRGQPKALGVSQQLHTHVSICKPAHLLKVSVVIYIHGLQWKSCISYSILSLDLAVAAENIHRRDLVKACLGMNVVSSIFAGVGFILYSVDLSIVTSDHYYPHSSTIQVSVCTACNLQPLSFIVLFFPFYLLLFNLSHSRASLSLFHCHSLTYSTRTSVFVRFY
ncbi:membrane-spanning 4-domains subfamily A member 15-like, partial [Huso huso]